jgi:hypothetical protein
MFVATNIFTTAKYLRRTTSGAADYGLDTTIKYLRRATSGAAGNDLGTTIKYLRRVTSGGYAYKLREEKLPRVTAWET